MTEAPRSYPGTEHAYDEPGLLPCPFCQSHPVLDLHYEDLSVNEPTDADLEFAVIRCTECGISKQRSSKDDLVAWWNKRALSVAQGSQEGTPSAAGVWFSSLIESLRPFAYYFDLNDCEGRSDGDALEIPVSDLRAARDLLKKLGIDTSLPPWAPSLPSTGGGTAA